MSTDEVIKSIIIEGDTRKMVDTASELGAQLKKEELTTSQIRNVFGSVKKIEMSEFDSQKTPKELLLLSPKLAYAASRPGAKEGIRHLKDVLIKAIDLVGDSEDRFANFCNFFEAILAYHRAADDK